ncbi:hypothetical protein EVAR_49770_1 [Eumeta japonica]|uniref:Mariner Mos1 transposase n=1 Tax=Eumeta variegata TaxID=151549 RepID=A0A4C1Y2S7_EUMVA|nr:hypothetical protein EVAR_49770_1 [Eumeta japonica]
MRHKIRKKILTFIDILYVGESSTKLVQAKRFQSGNLDFKDEPRSGRPVTDKVDAILEKIEQDRHIIFNDIANELEIAHKTVLTRLKKKLNVQKRLDTQYYSGLRRCGTFVIVTSRPGRRRSALSCSHTIDSDPVPTLVFDPSHVVDFGLNPAFDFDPSSVLDSAARSAFNSDSANNHNPIDTSTPSGVRHVVLRTWRTLLRDLIKGCAAMRARGRRPAAPRNARRPSSGFLRLMNTAPALRVNVRRKHSQ